MQTYFNTYSGAVAATIVELERRGYTLEDSEVFINIGMNSKRPAVGETTEVRLELLKDGKVQNKMAHMSVYGMKNSYELTMYVN